MKKVTSSHTKKQTVIIAENDIPEQEHPEIMVLFHGGGVCYKGAIPTARLSR